MSRVTSKLQVTIPKRLADRYGIRPGDEIDWAEAGDAIRVTTSRTPEPLDPARRLALFDRATGRIAARAGAGRYGVAAEGRGWTRSELYERARAR
jgi:AbrB family looped-hinge helix DNA binding protein